MPDEVAGKDSGIVVPSPEENAAAPEASRAARPAAALRAVRKSTTLRTAALVVGVDKQIFEPADPEAIIRKIGATARDGTDFDDIAIRLSFIALECVSTSHRETAPTAGELHAWFRSVKRDVEMVLAHFGIVGPLDHLESGTTINMLNTLLRAMPMSDGPDTYLRNMMAREVGVFASPDPTSAPADAGIALGATGRPSQWQALRATVRSMQFLLHGAQLAIEATEKGKGAPRRTPQEELNLVARVMDLYVEITGDEKLYTIPTDDEKKGGSVLVDFIRAVAAHIHAHLAVIEPSPPARLVKTLKDFKPRRIIERIRQVQKFREDQKAEQVPI
jgi:hypothetical protein